MTLEKIVRLGRVAREYSEIYKTTGVCGISGGSSGPAVQLLAKEFLETFGDRNFWYNHDKEQVEIIVGDVTFFALMNGKVEVA